MFNGHYDDWRKKRIDKIVSIYGKDFFDGKTILELGAGTGKNGLMFAAMGAKVTYAEARQEHLNVLLSNNPNVETILLDQDAEWNLGRKFDIVIHWGVLYHLDNWKRDLSCTIKHSNLIFLESIVCVSDDPNFEVKLHEEGYDQALHNIGSRPSAPMIESHLNQIGCTFTRYDDGDLNSSSHKYDWVVSETDQRDIAMGCRRFWIVKHRGT
jgi:hypothetical protein